jgi:hypothetical protein
VRSIQQLSVRQAANSAALAIGPKHALPEGHLMHSLCEEPRGVSARCGERSTSRQIVFSH